MAELNILEAELNIPEEVKRAQEAIPQVEKKIRGLRNYRSEDFSESQIAIINALIGRFNGFLEALKKIPADFAKLEEDMAKLRALGYPNQPSVEVSADMAAVLDREKEESLLARDLFTSSPTATTINVSFGMPQPKT